MYPLAVWFPVLVIYSLGTCFIRLLVFPCSPTILITASLIGRESPNLGFCYWGDPLAFLRKKFFAFLFFRFSFSIRLFP